MEKLAKDVWRYCFGNAEKGQDAFGIQIAKAAYGDENSKYGWNIDHTWPESRGGSNSILNMQPMSIVANKQKGNNLRGEINYKGGYSISYNVEKNFCLNKSNVGILAVYPLGKKIWISDGHIYRRNGIIEVAKLTKIDKFFNSLVYLCDSWEWAEKNEDGEIIYNNWNKKN